MSLSQEESSLSELISLKNRTAIITGGAAGLGLAIARRFAEAGAGIVIADVSDEAGLAACEDIRLGGGRADFIHCDVGVEEEVAAMVRQAADICGSLDILVNNAGIFPRIPLEYITQADAEQILAVNLVGALLCTRYTSEVMIAGKQGGSVINIASIDGLHPSSSGMSAYDASKGGLIMLTRSNARELGKHNIRVNAIAPGGMRTAGMESMVRPEADGESSREQMKEFRDFMKRMALGRMGTADEVARVALFLAGDMASYVTGSLVVVDGGYLVS